MPSGNTLTPSAMRCSSSSAGSFAFCAQRAGVVEEGDLCQKWECSFQLSWHRRRGRAHDAQLVMGFRVHAEALPHFTIVCHVRFPLRAKAASHPWGHAHMCPSRSVSNNYHATNHQPIRNTGAKKETSSDGAEWRTRCRCASVASPSRHMGHTLRVQNDDEAEFVVERGVAVYGVSVACTGCKRKL